MAGLNGTIIISNSEHRPCIADGKKALFHNWERWSEILPPSPMVGGHNGGVLQGTLAIVEYEDGTVGKVLPQSIKFVDNLFKEYDFGSAGND